MSYEYKEEILLDIGPEPNCNYESESNRYYDKIDELDHVYAQAAKADEYEKNKYRTHVNDRKAEAFDAILKSYDEALSGGHMADGVCNIIEKYESGEYDAKK